MNDLSTTLAVLEHYGLISGSILSEATIRIHCPVHGENKPSFDVDLAKGYCRCWGCRFHGDIADMVAVIERKNKLQALLKIAKIRKGIKPEDLNLRLSFSDVRQDAAKELEGSKAFFFSLSKTHWSEVRSHYLYDRGFKPETLDYFDVRINPSSEHPIAIPVFQDRLFKGYVLRSIDDRDDKYHFSRGFEKTRCVYGRTLSQDAPMACGLVVEGTLDRWAAWQHGAEREGVSTHSIQGWHISETQLDLLQAPLICGLDNDKNGWEGYVRLKEMSKWPVVRFPYPSWAKDTADLNEYEFRAALRHAKRLLGVNGSNGD